MSGVLNVGPGSVKHVHFEQDNRESMLDIYVSTESLKVYDTPWVEGASPNSPGPSQTPAMMSFVGETSVKRSPFRWDCVFLGVLCLLLLIGIVYLGVQMTHHQRTWRDNKALEEENEVYKNMTIQLSMINNELSEKIDALCSLHKKPIKPIKEVCDTINKERRQD